VSTCPEAVEGVHEDCCLHDLPRRHPEAPARVCCWCGDLYGADFEAMAEHGEYEPGLRVAERRKRARNAERGAQ
jgi:hypothetical protein